MWRWLAAVLVLLAAGEARARVWTVGPGRDFPTPSAAAVLVSDGDTVRIAPGSYRDCAIWRANDLTIEGAGASPDDTVIADLSCSGTGLFVTVGDRITIRNLTLARAQVPDANGAGIRAKGADLTVERVYFLDNENGILGEPNPNSTVTIRDSLFERNGKCEQACAHGIYINLVKLLRVERSRFLAQHIGHHIKSRAARTEVLDNDISDGRIGTASYLIDIPYGGDVLVRGNRMLKGAHSDNHTAAIIMGEEGVRNPTREIRIEDNSYVNEHEKLSAFVENRTGVAALLARNTLSGPVVLLRNGPPEP